MQIAINTRMLLPGRLEGVGVYTDQLVGRMAKAHSEDSFHLYFDRIPPEEYDFGANVVRHHVFPQARHPFLFYVWFQQTLRRAVSKLAPDVFFSPDGFMPLGLKIPSVITIHDPAGLRFPENVNLTARLYYRTFIPRFCREAAHIITVSEFSKREIVELLDIPPDNITVVYNGISGNYRPVDPELQRKTREKYTGGHPYIVYVGAIHPRKNLSRLIRAFDLYRGNNPSSELHLIIAGSLGWKYRDVLQSIETSRYGAAIKLPGYVDDRELPILIGSAEFMAYMSYYEGFGLPVLESMACGVPVLTSRWSAMEEVAGEAAVLADPMNEMEIAEGIDKLAGDPELRTACLKAGLERAGFFSWDEASAKTYELLRMHAR